MNPRDKSHSLQLLRNFNRPQAVITHHPITLAGHHLRSQILLEEQLRVCRELPQRMSRSLWCPLPIYRHQCAARNLWIANNREALIRYKCSRKSKKLMKNPSHSRLNPLRMHISLSFRQCNQGYILNVRDIELFSPYQDEVPIASCRYQRDFTKEQRNSEESKKVKILQGQNKANIIVQASLQQRQQIDTISTTLETVESKIGRLSTLHEQLLSRLQKLHKGTDQAQIFSSTGRQLEEEVLSMIEKICSGSHISNDTMTSLNDKANLIRKEDNFASIQSSSTSTANYQITTKDKCIHLRHCQLI